MTISLSFHSSLSPGALAFTIPPGPAPPCLPARRVRLDRGGCTATHTLFTPRRIGARGLLRARALFPMLKSTTHGRAWPLSPDSGAPKSARDVLVRGRTTWLTSAEITDILRNCR